jgi:hypothetical protein
MVRYANSTLAAAQRELARVRTEVLEAMAPAGLMAFTDAVKADLDPNPCVCSEPHCVECNTPPSD